MSVVVMPENAAQSWITFDSTIDETVSVTLQQGTNLVPGIELIGFLDDDIDEFECETRLEGDQIYIDAKATSSDTTDDLPGNSRRLCPGVGPLAPGSYTVHALGYQTAITVPSTVTGNMLFVPPMQSDAAASDATQ